MICFKEKTLLFKNKCFKWLLIVVTIFNKPLYPVNLGKLLINMIYKITEKKRRRFSGFSLLEMKEKFKKFSDVIVRFKFVIIIIIIIIIILMNISEQSKYCSPIYIQNKNNYRIFLMSCTRNILLYIFYNLMYILSKSKVNKIVSLIGIMMLNITDFFFTNREAIATLIYLKIKIGQNQLHTFSNIMPENKKFWVNSCVKISFCTFYKVNYPVKKVHSFIVIPSHVVWIFIKKILRMYPFYF